MKPIPGAIRTPDQRLRVFVSSTLKELAPERKFARAAVERLHLAPVMFELGARPHPPRELYRAYLNQSDVFVGLYGERYGWVAPGETVSGLEDEYNLATSLPKLIYIREPAPSREPRLLELLNRVRDDDRASFKYFSTPQELRRLLEADLATMLAERFDQSRRDADGPAPSTFGNTDTAPIPAPLTGLIGRERELQAVEQLLARDGVRLVTLMGPGGIGKSRLAIDIANRAHQRGDGEVAFVDLSPVRDAALVPNFIAEAVGVLDTGDAPVQEKLKTALRQRRMLVVVDNFEQVSRAALALVNLLSAAPGLKFLVTSRTLLRVTGEHAVEVGPLELPPGGGRRVGSPSAMDAASVALFVERARAVKPDFEVTPESAPAIVAICVALEGVPLAIELAAARSRMLPPSSMLARLDQRLALLAGGARDLPARQQALRSTIEWSTQLLGRNEKRLLAQLGVFAGTFSLEAAEHVGARSSDSRFDLLPALSTLVDSSLVREQDRGGRPYYSMLATVREYAVEKLQAGDALTSTQAAHAEYFVSLAASLETDLEGSRQREAIATLNAERDNLRAAARFMLDADNLDTVAEFAWALLIYWWVGGLLGEVRGWMTEVLAAEKPLTDRARAIALYFTRSITLWQNSNEWVVPGLTESAELFHRVDDRAGEGLARIFVALAVLADSPPDASRARASLEESVRLLREADDGWGEAMALVTLGRVALMQESFGTAIDRFEQSLAIARRRHDELSIGIALQHLGWAQLVTGRTDEARASFEESLATAAKLGHAEGVAYGLEGLTAIAAEDRRVERAERLLRASAALRKQTGLDNATSFSFHEHILAPILARAATLKADDGPGDGHELSIDEAVEFALHGE